jgi:peptidoglycan/xylan/chitin deacetylase (PgdA/CDA1 family)
MGRNAATVLVQYHFDAVAIWLNRYGYTEEPGRHSRGLFGAEVAAPRLLELHDRIDVPATWFIPGHTIESFPEIAGEVWDRGYDVQHHGWSHDSQNSFAGKEEVRADMVAGIESIADLTGREPTGYSSNRWGVFTADTVELLEELGFEWDSSQMGNDFRPYFVRKNWRAPPDGPYDPGEPTDILEFPVSWRRDDFPHFIMGKGIDSPGAATIDREVFRCWREQFDYMYDHVEEGIFNLTLHPQIIGMAPLPSYLEELFQYMRSKPNVEFDTFDSVAPELKRQLS